MKDMYFSIPLRAVRAVLSHKIGIRVIKIAREIPGFTKLFNLFYQNLKPSGITLIDVQGTKMYVDWAVDSTLLVFGRFSEIYETELFEKSIKPDSIVMDIGANVGWYTLRAARLAVKGRIYAFEPEPKGYALLLRNIDINGFTNVVPVQKAVSNKVGKIKLFVGGRWGGNSISDKNAPRLSGSIEVETTTLNNFCETVAKDNRVDVIKMDAEGAEGLIVEEGKRILQNNNLKIFMGLHPNTLECVGTDLEKLLEKLLELGFRISLIDEKRQRLVPVKIDDILTSWQNAKDPKEYLADLFLEK